MWTEYTEDVMAPEIVTPQQMEEQTEVLNRVRCNSNELIPPNSKNSLNLMTEDNEIIIISEDTPKFHFGCHTTHWTSSDKIFNNVIKSQLCSMDSNKSNIHLNYNRPAFLLIAGSNT